jgi:hypothetical protein
MDFLFDFCAKVLVKGIVRTLFNESISEWDFQQWLIFAVIISLLITVLYRIYRFQYSMVISKHKSKRKK